MNKNTKSYKKIVDDLIEKSFLSLKRRVIVFYFPCQIVKWANMGMTYLGPIMLLFVFPRSKGYSDKELMSIFAHELAHYEIIRDKSFFDKICFGFRWLFTKKGKSDFETAADKRAVQYGYAKGLYSRLIRNEKKMTKEQFKKRLSRGYLSSSQIKKYAKKIKKW